MELLKNNEGYHFISPNQGGEYSLCGDAIEGTCMGQTDEGQPMKIVQGNRVTCKRCLIIINEVSNYLKTRNMKLKTPKCTKK